MRTPGHPGARQNPPVSGNRVAAPRPDAYSRRMPITSRTGSRTLTPELCRHLDEWVGIQPLTHDLHSGDVGWQLRFDDTTLLDSVLLWEADGTVVAGGLLDGDGLRPAVAPTHRGDPALARAMAHTCDGLAYADVAPDTALAAELRRRGWAPGPSPWSLLYRDLTPADRDRTDPLVRPLAGPDDVSARTAVQRSAFGARSTFRPALWQRMSEGPTYAPRFDLVAWTVEDEAVAAATGWFAGPGRCAILEPVGTHADHRRQGHGRRVNLAVMAALARAGASGVRVHTPAANAAAVAAYLSCGLREVARTPTLFAP